MKAIVCDQYGSADALTLREVAMPVPKSNEVRIKICSATVTAGDCEIRKFNIPVLFWIPLRVVLGVRKPRPGIFGQEYAGEIDVVGVKVTRFDKRYPLHQVPQAQRYAEAGLKAGNVVITVKSKVSKAWQMLV